MVFVKNFKVQLFHFISDKHHRVKEFNTLVTKLQLVNIHSPGC